MGGFPGQVFSGANAKGDVNVKRHGLREELIRVIRAKQPKLFLAENVKGLTS
ncbi:MAG: DNA cytosine methyltransferase [Deltaproteobacteria bacterium]|nr:DNA cytosine methyltransferase [Deltaproteobacteria bacterium]